MMETMRNAAKGWVAKLLIGMLAVSFGVWGIADVFRNLSSGALVTVGKAEISPQEFSQAFNQYLQNFNRQTGQSVTPEEARKLGIDKSVLNTLIQSAAIDNQSLQMKLAVPDAMLAQEAMQNQEFQGADGKFDATLFKRLLASNGMSEAGYFAEERRIRLREAVTGTANGNVAPAKSAVEALYRYRNEQRDARYFVLRTAETEIAAPAEDEVKAEYEANPTAYTAPEYRAIAVMKVEPKDIAAKVELSDADITAGFDRYKTDYFTAEKRTILQISFPTLDEARAAKDRIAAGTEFLDIAKERGFAEADVTFAGKQTRRGIKSNPACARQIHFAPRVEIGEVHLGAARPVERLHIGRELNQVAGNEARGEAHRAHRLHEQPAGVAARSAGLGERFLRRLHARFEADGVFDVVQEPLVDLDEEINRARLYLEILREQFVHEREVFRRRLGQFHERRKLLLQRRLIDERINLRRLVDEEVERIMDRHLGDEFHLDAEFLHLVWKDKPRVPVGERVLMPVDEVFAARDFLRVAENLRPAMRRRPQAHDMRAVAHGLVVGVVRLVVEGDVDGHEVVSNQ